MEVTAAVKINVISPDIRKAEGDAIVVGIFEDTRPLKGFAGQLDWLLCGSLSYLLLTNRMRGSLGDVALCNSRGKVPSPKIFMMGLGPSASFSQSTLRAAGRTAAASVLGAGATRAVIECVLPSDAALEDCIPLFQEGLEEGAGGRRLAVSLIAQNRDAQERIARLVKASSPQ